MLEKTLFLLGFFICTLWFQWLLHKIGRNRNRGNSVIWVGYGAIVAICVIGLISNNANYFSALIGFIIADRIGEKAGWH